MKGSRMALCATIFLCAAFACLGGCAAHHFSEDWTYDASHHWHACTDAGCGWMDEESIGEHAFEIKDVVEPASCQKEGSGHYFCAVCGYSDPAVRAIPKTEHEWELVETERKATCFSNGVGTFACKNCEETKRDVIPATGEHTLSKKYSSDENGHYYVCTNRLTVNGETQNCPYHTEAEPHIEGEPVVVQPTASKSGSKTYSCTVCGYVIRTVILPATNVPKSFEVTLTPKNFAGDPVVITKGADGVYECELLCGSTEAGSFVSYEVAFVNGKNAEGESVGIGTGYSAQRGGIRAYVYDDSGAGSYTSIEDLTAVVNWNYFNTNGTLQFKKMPASGTEVLSFRYETVTDGETVVHAEVRIRVTGKFYSEAAAALAADLPVRKKYGG